MIHTNPVKVGDIVDVSIKGVKVSYVTIGGGAICLSDQDGRSAHSISLKDDNTTITPVRPLPKAGQSYKLGSEIWQVFEAFREGDPVRICRATSKIGRTEDAATWLAKHPDAVLVYDV